MICRTLEGKQYTAGVVGLNNIGASDYINVIIQALSHVSALRNYFLVPQNYEFCKSEMVKRFGTLMRRMWSSQNFKNQVSPHEFLQEIVTRSKKKFKIGERENSMTFLSWLLNTLHADLTEGRAITTPSKPSKQDSIISDCFRGVVRVVTEKEDDKDEVGKGEKKSRVAGPSPKIKATTQTSPFFFSVVGYSPSSAISKRPKQGCYYSTGTFI